MFVFQSIDKALRENKKSRVVEVEASTDTIDFKIVVVIIIEIVWTKF